MFPMIKDAEAAVYAIEAAICFCNAIAEGDIYNVAVNLFSLFGWTKNAVAF